MSVEENLLSNETFRWRSFESLRAGERFVSVGRTLTETDLVTFTGLSGDFHPVHTDEHWSREHTEFDGRIAHGLLVLAISSGLRVPGLEDLHIIAYINTERAMVAPTYPGDTIHSVVTVTEVRPSNSRPGCGVATFDVETRKQDETVVQRGKDVYLLGSR